MASSAGARAAAASASAADDEAERAHAARGYLDSARVGRRGVGSVGLGRRRLDLELRQPPMHLLHGGLGVAIERRRPDAHELPSEPPQGALDREITPAKSGRGEGTYRLHSFGTRYET